MPSFAVESDAVKSVELLPGEELCETVALTNRGQCAAEHIEIWARFGPRQQPRLLFSTTAGAVTATSNSSSSSGASKSASSSGSSAEKDSSYEVDSAALLQQLRSYPTSSSSSSSSSSSNTTAAPVLPPGCTVRIPLRIRAGQPGSANAEVRGEVAIKYAASTAAGYSRWLTLPLRARPAPGLRVLRMLTLMPLASSSSSSSSSSGGGSSTTSSSAEGLAEDTDAPACRLALTLVNDAPVPVAVWRRCAAGTSAAGTAALDGQHHQQPVTAAAAAVWAVVPASGRIVVLAHSTVTAVFGMQRLRYAFRITLQLCLNVHYELCYHTITAGVAYIV
jgi:hypothetical protein